MYEAQYATKSLHLHLETAKAASTLNVAVSGLRFFYQRVLNRPFTHLERNLPRPRQAKRRPKASPVTGPFSFSGIGRRRVWLSVP